MPTEHFQMLEIPSIFWAMLDDIEQRTEKQLTVYLNYKNCVRNTTNGVSIKRTSPKRLHKPKENNQRISIDYISRDPSKPIRTRRELEVTKWDSPHLEANCLLRGEPRRFHLKQIQRRVDHND